MDREELRAKIAAEHGVDIGAVTIDAPDEAFEKLTILVNDNAKMTPKKLAAQAVHAALAHYGIVHGTVVVLGARPGQIRDQCDVIIQDAGITELTPGTLTAGVKRGDEPRQG